MYLVYCLDYLSIILFFFSFHLCTSFGYKLIQHKWRCPIILLLRITRYNAKNHISYPAFLARNKSNIRQPWNYRLKWLGWQLLGGGSWQEVWDRKFYTPLDSKETCKTLQSRNNCIYNMNQRVVTVRLWVNCWQKKNKVYNRRTLQRISQHLLRSALYSNIQGICYRTLCAR